MANPGALTIGPTLLVAHQRMECLEHAAHIMLTTRVLGRTTELTPAQVADLLSVRARGGGSGTHPANLARPSQRGEE
jgi:hypothetical protein